MPNSGLLQVLGLMVLEMRGIWAHYQEGRLLQSSGKVGTLCNMGYIGVVLG